jgi:hypothetical protein
MSYDYDQDYHEVGEVEGSKLSVKYAVIWPGPLAVLHNVTVTHRTQGHKQQATE